MQDAMHSRLCPVLEACGKVRSEYGRGVWSPVVDGPFQAGAPIPSPGAGNFSIRLDAAFNDQSGRLGDLSQCGHPLLPQLEAAQVLRAEEARNVPSAALPWCSLACPAQEVCHPDKLCPNANASARLTPGEKSSTSTGDVRPGQLQGLGSADPP